MSIKYNTGGNTSTIDLGNASKQIRDVFHKKESIKEARKLQYFSQLADVTAMPKNHGKTIEQYVYIPLLDDANINDQGLDAAGAVITDGNLYGSSKDIGSIPNKLPVLGEMGGQVNRVGFARKLITGTFENYGFHSTYTRDSVDFDTDPDLLQHYNRETIFGATELTEDTLQIDLINNAGVEVFPGAATTVATVAAGSMITYDDLVKMSITLDQNRTPKQTKYISGSRMVDTRTIPNGRALYIGSELLPMIKQMKDYFNNQAFVSVEKYASGGSTKNDSGPEGVFVGEVGSIESFRVIVVPEMLNWTGGGAGGIDVYPMLCVGDGAFTTIAFQTGGGQSFKFKQVHKKPEELITLQQPYAKEGLMSIEWYYGFLATRPERIALAYTAAV